MLFAVIFGIWTYVFVAYFRSRSNTPQIDSNQFRILTKETEKYSDTVEKQIQPHTLNNGLPFFSVILPVRNEEKYIQRCLLSLLDQDYPYFEVIVVDDNSTDDTLKAIQKVKKRKGTLHYQEIEKRALLAIEEEEEEETKLKILSLKDKPENWAGKTWASEQGYLKSKGSILLFTDGDTRYHRKDVISSALSYMHRQNLDVLTGIPSSGKIQDSWSKILLPLWELVNVLFGVNNTADVNNPKSKYAYLMGSFFIIKRKVFKDIGTFHSVRGALQEDKALGFSIKEKGYDMKIVRLNGLVSLEGSKKNLFGLWHLIGRTVAPLVVKNRVRVVTNLFTIFLISLLPFITLTFMLFSIVHEQIHFSSPAPPTLQIFLSQPGSDYYLYYWILLLNIICCLIVIIASAIKGILEYRLSPIYSLLSLFGASFLTVACAYCILPLLLFSKTRPIVWQGRKYIYKKEQGGFSL
ncbi:MAG: glycosyltransferase [Thermoproteota archaeon]|nr:glycosyltransferase [Thermoproteota archaeon]